MAKHIHVHIHRASARDAGTAHDPSNGQFTAGSNGGSGTVVKHQPSGTTVPHQAPKPATGKGSAHQEAAEYAHTLSKRAEQSGNHIDHKAAAEAHQTAGDLNDKADHIMEASVHYRMQGHHERRARELAQTK